MFALLKKAAEVKGRIGLAFGHDRIALAVVTGGRGHALLERCEVLPLDPALGAEAAVAALRSAALPRLPISTVLQAGDYQMALVEAPEVPRAELRAAIRWRLKEAIDFPVENAVVDVFDVPAPSGGSKARMMYAVAALRGVVDRHAALLAATGSFEIVDVPELCLRNLAAALPAAARGVALLHLVESTATIVLVQGRTFYFARQMDLQSSLKAGGDPGAGAQLDVSGIVLELQRSLDYYERHFDQPPITRIAIAPTSPRAEMLALKLGHETGFEVAAIDLNAIMRCAMPVAAATQADCLLAVAAALREERRSL